ncbi:EAL domain-containing protein [Iamia sp. SCSIO 61187]|uniref:putative bifunctional diguanylate cyclase/phosphodiesterase n=1 Tax=Iamia sp. SCSIO 61187 TaxID=2722752 RepID=UPI001C630A32|nr:GGDEF domain-containing phosphodiesterase [Iamia sp. SCSIO 61187]QYG94958.1 EAL domain-containing protein [Iamia sp. SCSIO 61187]
MEILVPERRPPDAVLATTELGRQILDGPAPLASATDDALARLAPEHRPFDPEELAQIRAESDEWVRSPDTIRARLGPLTTRTEKVMLRYATATRFAAVELGDLDLIAAGTTFQRSIRLPDAAGEVVASLSDLWAAGPEDRPRLQSQVAAGVARFTTLSELFADSVTDPDGPVAAYWSSTVQVPPTIRSVLDEVESASLSSPDRRPGEPAAVGAALLEAIDWTIEADALPLIAAEVMIGVADDVADEARANERLTGGLVLLAIALSVTAAVLFGRSIVTPVRRLTDHAERIGRGELTLDPLPLGGPPEVATASVAFNDVVGTLRLLEQKGRALADVDLDHPSLHQALPGELGAALQRSTEVLSTSIVEREHLRSQLSHDATHDSLTGLANRAALMDALAQQCAGQSPRAAAIFIDLDDFKRINDRLGHAGGDLVLQVVADRIAALAPTGSTVARLGGDEFVVVLSGATIDDAAERARAMVAAVAQPIRAGGQANRIKACAGVAAEDEASSPLAGPTDLLHRADLAVYDAKRVGPGTVVCFDAGFGDRVAHQNDVEEALAAALRPGADELRLVFQPIVATSTGALVGVETLIRWRRDGAWVMPDDFIPIAERSGLVVRLDLWVLQAATAQMAAWADVPELADMTVSVNLSGRTLMRPTLPAEVEAALRAYDLAPNRLIVEVTETALITDLDLAAAQIDRVRASGVRVAIDDFGTGYTSIAQLRALPVDELKIDGSFIRGLPETTDRVLLQIVEDLADHLELFTVAEGVETAGQVEELAAIGCGALQGYFFSRPLDPDALARWAAGRMASSPR